MRTLHAQITARCIIRLFCENAITQHSVLDQDIRRREDPDQAFRPSDLFNQTLDRNNT